jgi:hypothetical protein
MAGPLLFSWHNNKQFENLLSYSWQDGAWK